MIVAIRLNPAPLNEIFEFGTSEGLDDSPFTFNSAAAVSRSATVNEMETEDLPCAKDCDAIGEIVGGVFAAAAGGN